ncbi:YhfL family protein [Serratia silvae]|uniref:YhfL family protein n=1 Tax=Serratia silvae TaxID=2824122 RepID=A0ABT0KFV1_9GAMM|nr:YhfL family protein [Serratia silvae]MCL1030899.1 YhfL family protein [Serratia silvae]
MNKLAKLVLVAAALSTLTACTGRIENKTKDCSYDYLLHPAISISKIIGGCGPTNK